eukprot:COSAG01_NODE_60828_length_292_cov_1.336788_1_plen_91_part_01
MLPWTEIDKLHTYLKQIGIAEGCLLVNGDQTDLNNATSFVSKGTPVITLKSVGGASEYLANLFEQRQVRHDPAFPNRPVGFQPRYDDPRSI